MNSKRTLWKPLAITMIKLYHSHMILFGVVFTFHIRFRKLHDKLLLDNKKIKLLNFEVGWLRVADCSACQIAGKRVICTWIRNFDAILTIKHCNCTLMRIQFRELLFQEFFLLKFNEIPNGVYAKMTYKNAKFYHGKSMKSKC